MKKLLKSIIVTILVVSSITSLSMGAFAVAKEEKAEIMSRDTYVNSYSDEELLELVCDGTIVDDPYAEVTISHEIKDEYTFTTVNISELEKTSVLSNGSFVESYISTAICYAIPTSRAAGSMSVEEWLSTDIRLTATIFYDKLPITITGSRWDMIKITKYQATVHRPETRWTITQLDMFVRQTGDAYNSAGVRQGLKGEDSAWSQPSPSMNTLYFLDTNFTYYILDNDMSPVSNIGGAATVYYHYQGQTEIRNFSVYVTIL